MQVSIVIAARNVAPHLLDRAISSAVAQTHPAVEIVICDDGSQPPVELPATAYARDGSSVPITIVRHRDSRGISAARNAAVKAASGNWLCWLDGDDYLSPTCVTSLLSKLSGSVDLVLGDCIVMQECIWERRLLAEVIARCKAAFGTADDPFAFTITSIQPQLFRVVGHLPASAATRRAAAT